MRNCLRFQHIVSAVVVLLVVAAFSGQGLAAMLDLAGAPTFMSSAETPGLGDTNALWDGDRGTRIATGDNTNDPPGGDGNDNEWFYVDLGQPHFLDQIRIDWEAAFGQDFDILVSNTDPGGVTNPNDAIWRSVAVVREYDQDAEAPPNHGADVDNIIDFTTGSVQLPSDLGGGGFGAAARTPEGQYVMLHGIERGSQWGFSIWEMEIDGTPVPEPSSLVLMLGGFFALAGYTVRFIKGTR